MTLELARKEEKVLPLDTGDPSNRSAGGLGVYHAINAVQMEIARAGIEKLQQNKYDNYKFRGIDDVYNHLAPILGKHGLCILPRMVSRTCDERVSQKGGPMFYVTVTAEFDFVSAQDGSKHTVKMFGEAMDRSDKATNKALSAAYKYACFQTFCIPTEGDNDADANSPEIKANQETEPSKRESKKESRKEPKKESTETQKEPDPKKESKPSEEKVQDNTTMSPAQAKAIVNLAKRRGINETNLEGLCQNQYGCPLQALPAKEASAFIQYLQKAA